MALRSAGNPPITASVPVATNPTTNTVMADSGAVTADGNYEARIILSQSANAVYSLQRRNAANDGNVSPYPIILYGSGGISSQYALLVRLNTSERLRVLMGGNLTGDAQVVVQIERMD